MYTFKHFVGHDYHVLRKATYVVRFYKIHNGYHEGWLREITNYKDCGKDEDLTVFWNDNDAFEAYSEAMESYGFKKFDIRSGNY